MLRPTHWNLTGLGEVMENETLEKPGRKFPLIMRIPFGRIFQRFKLVFRLITD